MLFPLLYPVTIPADHSTTIRHGSAVFLPRVNVHLVRIPFRRVVFNIFRNTVHFMDITYDMVVKTRLPPEGNAFSMRRTADARFHAADNRSQ